MCINCKGFGHLAKACKAVREKWRPMTQVPKDAAAEGIASTSQVPKSQVPKDATADGTASTSVPQSQVLKDAISDGTTSTAQVPLAGEESLGAGANSQSNRPSDHASPKTYDGSADGSSPSSSAADIFEDTRVPGAPETPVGMQPAGVAPAIDGNQ